MSQTTKGLRVALLLGCVLLAGCSESDAEKTTATGPATATTPPAARLLPAEWYEDPDGDVIPTAVERAIGSDPDVDECVAKSGCSSGGAVNALERTNTLLILDSSGSMSGTAGGGMSKLAAAKKALRGYVAGTPDSAALGFEVFGHKGSSSAGGKAASCAGVELLLPIGTAAWRRFDATIDRFTPRGYTPLAAALRRARDAFDGKEDDINRIIVVTDGGETCGGDPVAEARALKRAGISVTTDIVGFDVAKPDEAERLRAIAEAAGGTYTDARTADALSNYFAQAVAAYQEAVKTYLCLLGNRAKQAQCMGLADGRALAYMNRAFAKETGPRADEILRLTSTFDKASSARRDAFQDATDATEARLNREVEAARRRYESLSP